MIIMDKNTVTKVVKFITNNAYPLERVKKSWPDFLRLIGVTHGEAVQSIYDYLDKTGEDFGLSYDQLVRLAHFFGSKRFNTLIYTRKIPPKEQEKHPELMKDSVTEAGGGGAAGPAPGVGTATTTQNTAPYPIPLGTLRREWWKKRKKKKKGA
jgi:hypothetical protein